MRVVAGQQHRVEVEPRQGAQVHLGNGDFVSCHADEAHQPLLARLDGRFERAARPQRDLPLVGRNQMVKLEQIHMIGLEPVQRLDGSPPWPSRYVRSPVLVARKNVLAVPLHPRADAQLRVTVAEGGVDVVDAVAQQ